jgi:hypothetical protein
MMIDINKQNGPRNASSFSSRVLFAPRGEEGQYIYERYNTRGGIIIMIILVRTAQHSYTAFHALSNPVLEDV